MYFLLNFRQTSGIGMFQSASKETFGCLVDFYEEIIAML